MDAETEKSLKKKVNTLKEERKKDTEKIAEL